jgi:hypothetical protein
MWIVQLALRRPYTFIVAGLLLLIVSPLVILRTPTDIFPNINIPVVSIVWQYTGMPPTEFAGRITSVYERALTTTVNDIEHIESQSFNGVWVIKVFFQPSAKIEAALAQVTAIAQTITRQTPAGVTPPLVITYNASSVPILQLGLSGEGLSEQQLNDFTMNNIRTLLATVPGASIPWPYGGKVRQITIALDLQKLNGLGDLITAGTDSTPDNAKALFHLARTDILRVFIDVPQADSPAVSKGTKAYLQVQEFPGEKFEGRITNISGAIDPATRTLLTEVQVPNADGRLFPGAYAQVHLVLPVKRPWSFLQMPCFFEVTAARSRLSTETASSTSGT